MNPYRYKIHYKKYDIINIGGAVQVQPVTQQYYNIATQQQIALAQQAAIQQAALQQAANQQAVNQQAALQQAANQQAANQQVTDKIPLQVHTINELFKRVQKNNDLAIYMLDYIKTEKPFFDNNKMLTTNDNEFAIKIIDKCLTSAFFYSKKSTLWLRLLQFLKYLDKNNQNVPKAINIAFIKMLNKINYLARFINILDETITIKNKINCSYTSKKILCGHTPTQLECIKLIIKIIKDIEDINLKNKILSSTFKDGTETILHRMASQEIDIDILIDLIDTFIETEKIKANNNTNNNTNNKEKKGFTKKTSNFINFRFTNNYKQHILLKTEDGNINYGYSIRFLIKVHEKYNKDQINIYIYLEAIKKLVFYSFKEGYGLKITADEIIKLFDIFIKMGGRIEYINSYIEDDLFLVKNWKKNNLSIITYGIKLFIRFMEYINENINLTIYKSLIIKNKIKIIHKFYIEGLNVGVSDKLINKLKSHDPYLKEKNIVPNLKEENNKEEEIKKQLKLDFDNKYKSYKESYDKEINNILEIEHRNRVKDANDFKKLVNQIKESYEISDSYVKK
jgi:hypothetical protein